MSASTSSKYAVELRHRISRLGIGFVATVELIEIPEEAKDKKIDFHVLWENDDRNENQTIIKYLVSNYLRPLFNNEQPEELLRFDEVFGFIAPTQQAAIDIFEHIKKDVSVNKQKSTVTLRKDFQFEVNKIEPRLIVVTEKNGSLFYLAKNIQEAGHIYLTVLKNKLEDLQYNWLKDYHIGKEKPKYSREEIDALPEAMDRIKDQLRKDIAEFEQSENQAKLFHALYDRIIKALENGDPYEAKAILWHMSSLSDYQSINIEEFNEIDWDIKCNF